MTQPAKSQEPSMEEILASIRRIIADDPARAPRQETTRGQAARGEKPQTKDTLSDRAPFSGRRDDLPRPLPPRDSASQSFPRPFSSARAAEGNTGAAPPSRSASFLPGATPSISSARAEQPFVAPPEPVSPQQQIDAMLAELNSRTRPAPAEPEPEPEQPPADVLELT